jgi:SAM-dependent methyltransferase
MRYNLPEFGLEVRSEYAAKPTKFRSKYLLDWLTSYQRVETAVDYGCGRLRYSIPLTAVADKVIAVDSVVQLERMQIIDGGHTNVRQYASEKPSIRVFDIERFATSTIMADLVICINVLSAIPFETDRLAAVSRVARHLRPDGRCLFVVQHRNSDFNRVLRSGAAREYRDGYIIEYKKRASFYGLLNRDYIGKLMGSSGLSVESAFIRGQSTYVLGRSHTPRRGGSIARGAVVTGVNGARTEVQA